MIPVRFFKSKHMLKALRLKKVISIALPKTSIEFKVDIRRKSITNNVISPKNYPIEYKFTYIILICLVITGLAFKIQGVN